VRGAKRARARGGGWQGSCGGRQDGTEEGSAGTGRKKERSFEKGLTTGS